MLEALVDGVWTAHFPLSVMGLRLGTRMTVLRLSSGGLLLVSPVPITEELRAAVDAIGTVEHLVSPNLFHYMYINEWKQAYPEATLWAEAALADKKPEIKIDQVLGDEIPAVWANDLDMINVRGMPAVRERIFLHKGSGTLVQTDMVFNISDAGWMTNAYLSMCGIKGKVGSSYLLKMVTKDKPAAAGSIDEVLAWDFDNMVVPHGDNVVGGAREQLRAGLSWLPIGQA